MTKLIELTPRPPNTHAVPMCHSINNNDPTDVLEYQKRDERKKRCARVCDYMQIGIFVIGYSAKYR